jgi:hypothetical protein
MMKNEQTFDQNQAIQDEIQRLRNDVNLANVAEAIQIDHLHQQLERMNMTRVSTQDSNLDSPASRNDQTFDFATTGQ